MPLGFELYPSRLIHTNPDQAMIDLSLFQGVYTYATTHFVRELYFSSLRESKTDSLQGESDRGRPHPLFPASGGNKHHRLMLNLGCLPVPLSINLLRGVADKA